MQEPQQTLFTARALRLTLACLVSMFWLMACGGGSDAPATDQAPAAAATTPTILSESGSQSARVGEAVTFSVIAEAAQRYQWQAKAGTAWADVPGADAASYTVPDLTLQMNGARYRVVVLGAVGSVVSSEFAVTVGESLAAPTITTQPADASVTVGQSVTLRVVADASSPRFSWQVSSDRGATWSVIGSATTDSLLLPNLTKADDGKRYRVIVSNPAGVITSATALLTVTESVVAPTIATQPAGVSANPGQDVSFSVGAVGSNLEYQWQSRASVVADWTPIAGANAATYRLNPAKPEDNGRSFRVIVSNSAGNVPSSDATLTVTDAVVAPSIVTEPVDQAAREGESPRFSVSAGGSSPSYRWEESTDQGATWTDAPGGSGPALVRNNVTLTDSGKKYRVIVTNSAGNATSREVTLTVSAAPIPLKIKTEPLGARRIVGQSVTMTVAAEGGATLSYSWEEETAPSSDAWTTVPDVTSNQLTVAGLTIAHDRKRYRAKVSSTDGQSATSKLAVLNVAWGSVTTSDDLSTIDVLYGGGDSGDSPGGGDGAGADGGGGLGKTLNAELTVTRIADGALVGSALTHPSTGLVKIKAGPGAAPFLLTLRGNAKASYYDEGRAEVGQAPIVPFPEGAVLHALVDTIDENLGVTPLTEAAYRYAINNFLADPAAIAAGKAELRRSVTDLDLRKLTKAQIQASHQAVLNAVNRALPASYRMVSLKSLPTPVDEKSPSNALKENSRYAIAQLVTGGLVAAVGQYNPDLPDPALAAVEQFAQDLTDGRLDGLALDGKPMAGDRGTAAYDSARLPTALNIGADKQAKRFGTAILQTANPFVEVAEYVRVVSQDLESVTCEIAYVALRSDGLVSRNLGVQKVPGTRCPADVAVTSRNLDWGGIGRELQPDVFIVSDTGALFGIGSTACGRLGTTAKDNYDTPIPVPLKDITAMVSGSANSVARTSKGQVVVLGKNVNGSLGVGARVAGGLPLCEGARSTFDPIALPELAGAVSLFKGGDTTFFAVGAKGELFGWGSGQQGQFGVLDGKPLPDRPTPELAQKVDTVRAVAATATTVHVLNAKGTVWGWGLNTNGEFGDGTTTPKPNAEPLTFREAAQRPDITQLVSNQNSLVYGLDADGKVWRWGSCVPPQCDKPTPVPPAPLAELPQIRNLSPGTNRVFAMAADGRVFGLYPAAKEVIDVTGQFNK
jgi:hypothetical protein